MCVDSGVFPVHDVHLTHLSRNLERLPQLYWMMRGDFVQVLTSDAWRGLIKVMGKDLPYMTIPQLGMQNRIIIVNDCVKRFCAGRILRYQCFC